MLKRKLMKFKTLLMRELRTKAIALGHNEVNFTVSPKEILQILVPAVREFLVESTKEQLVLKGARSNGMLAWRAIRGKFEQITKDLGCRRSVRWAAIGIRPVGWVTGSHGWGMMVFRLYQIGRRS